MSRTETDNELYDAHVTKQTEANIAALTQGVIDGDADALRVVDDALAGLEGAAWTELLRKSVAGVNALQDVCAKAIADEAERRATADADRIDNERPPRTERAAAARAEQRAWDRLMAGQLEFT